MATALPELEDRVLTDDELEKMDQVLARGQLSVGRPDLPARQPAAPRAARASSTSSRACSATGARRPGLNFIYVHLNRVDQGARPRRDLHRAARATAAPAWSRTPTSRARTARSIRTSRDDAEGMQRLFKQFSFPGGIPSHVAPETPGSIHEGGELGYALSHAFGAAFDNPDLIVACVVGDGEAETGPLATRVALEQVPQPASRRRRAADPAPERLQDRQPDGAGAHHRTRSSRASSRLRLQAVLRRGRRSRRRCTSRWRRRWTRAIDEIRAIQQRRAGERQPRAAGVADDRPAHAEGLDRARRRSTARRRRAPGARTRCRSPTMAQNPEHVRLLEQWMKSYRPRGALRRERRAPGRSCASSRRRATGAWGEPARQRRPAAEGPAPAGFPGLRGRGQRARRRHRRGDEGARATSSATR